jgi:hypothetical protein
VPLYRITCQRETQYEFEIVAENEMEAERQVEQIELTGDVENYAIDWYPLELLEVEEVTE